MSTKSKTPMETQDVEAKVRPSRNVKPVSYKEHVERKRGQAVKESTSEPKDKKKKKVNGNSNVDDPSKKIVKKKADAKNDKPNGNGESDDDELMQESREQKDEAKPAAEEAVSNSKKAQPRKKKVEETVTDASPVDDAAAADEKVSEAKVQKDSKTTVRRKAKDTVEETNGEGSSKPLVSKTTKGKNATSRAPVDAVVANTDEGPPKALVSKTAKGKKATSKASVDAEVEIVDNRDVGTTKPLVSKTTKGKKATSKASVDAVVANTDEATSKALVSKTTKGKKATSPTPVDAAVESVDNQDEGSSKPIASKTAKGKKATSHVDAVVESDKPLTSKTAKGKKAAKESNDAEDDAPVVEASKSKTKPVRAVKPTTKDPPKATKRKAEQPPPATVIKPKLTKNVTPTTNLQSSNALVDLFVPAKEWNLKITTWNVAGLRALVKKDGMKFIDKERPDIFCLQETKCLEEEVPDAANIKGYHKYWLGTKGGQAGVALYSKTMPYEVTYGLKDSQIDEEARLITAVYTKFHLVCVYVPNAGRKLVNLEKRLRWDSKFQDYLVELNKTKPVIICGDMNVAHLEIDLANPKANKRNAGFTEEERNGMTNMFSKGFVDTFRQLYPDKAEAYTFWTYMANARAKNVGWRLDYFIVSERLLGNVVDNVIRSSIGGSDHCPVTLFLKF